ncbi:MAG: aspartate--tRNA ligase [Cyclobacteriaceae bacterium]|nr:aspartate--tRNA ligase [Cyclobacteriaceae bacterium]
MLRTHNCGELRLEDATKQVTLCGWVQKVRDKGGMIWIDLRDRYGITQLVFDESKSPKAAIETARKLGREYVIQSVGTVVERYAKNDKMPTGNIEIDVEEIRILNPSIVPPFTIEDETDGGDELRMKYRYLDIRRNPVRKSLELRHQMLQQTRQYMDGQHFMEVETPVLIKSTPEGARDFVVPSRVNKGEFYALPQSPQTFKQLLMVSGIDRYFQIVKCFRDEDLRADRQPEFTQIDCEMSFITRDDILSTFEGLIRHLFKQVLHYDLGTVVHMSYDDAMKYYGNDKPDLRFEMQFSEIDDLVKGKGFSVFDDAEIVVGICAPGCAEYTRKQLDELTEYVKKPQIGAKGLVYSKYNIDGSFKSSIDKFYSQEDQQRWADRMGARPGDLMLILSGPVTQTRSALSELRLKMGTALGLRTRNVFKALWLLDFPLLEWDEASQRFHAMHHPFTSPTPEDMDKLGTDPGSVKANAYDLVINGVEIGGGSIRIHDKKLQQQMFNALGFTEVEAKKQFGFLLDAFEFGAPPHGGIAFGFDRLCAMFGGSDSIRDYIAFPKNNSGRDVMIDTPSTISQEQLDELSIALKQEEKA